MNDFWDILETTRDTTKDMPGKFAEQLIDDLVSLGLPQVLDFYQ